MANFWVVVADGSKARFFQGASPTSDLEEFHTLVNEEGRLRGQDINTDAPGRRRDEGRVTTASGKASGSANVKAPQSGIANRSAMSADPKEQEQRDFAKEVGEFLEEKRKQGDFSKLSIIASPKFLGELRNKLSSATGQVVLDEIDKNLVNADIDQIRSQLKTLAL